MWHGMSLIFRAIILIYRHESRVRHLRFIVSCVKNRRIGSAGRSTAPRFAIHCLLHIEFHESCILSPAPCLRGRSSRKMGSGLGLLHFQTNISADISSLMRLIKQIGEGLPSTYYSFS